jgi:putative tryptophan/tyrosine transport system substrate-binding protein
VQDVRRQAVRGNATGLLMMQSETASKRVELLRDIIPGLRRLAILANVENRGAVLELESTEAAAQALSLDPVRVEIRRAEDVPTAIKALNRRADALYECIDPLVNSIRVRINALALEERLPVMHSFRENVENAGGLISYGPDILGMYQRAADLVDKILRGAKPADIPVEQPTKFTLVINLKTAKALGLTIPETLLTRADEVLE